MASTFHDSAQADNDASGTTLSTADALAVTAGDLVWAGCKWESPNTPTCTVDTGGGTTVFTTARAKMTTGWGAYQTFYWIAESTGTVNPRMVLSAGADGRRIKAMSFTPDAGLSYTLGNTNEGSGTSSTPSTGSAASTGAAVVIAGFGMFASSDLTVGSGWSSPSEFGSQSGNAEYRIESGSGTFTGDGTWDAGVIDWAGQINVFNEIALIVGATRIPFVGTFGRNRTRYAM